jgi:hypothetical protein
MKIEIKNIRKAFSELIAKAPASGESQGVRSKKRLSMQLTRRRQFVAIMQQDELKQAIDWAEDLERPRRNQLYAIYREVLRDAHLFSQMQTNILKVVGSPFGVFNKGSEEVDEQATRLLQRMWFEQYRKLYHEARFWGHSLIEFQDMQPGLDDGLEREFASVKLIDRDHVRPETGEVVLDIADEKGIPYREAPWNESLIEVGEPNDLGILMIAAKEVIFKNFSRTDWSRHYEKYGIPLLAIKTASREKKELDEKQQMASEFGNNLWVILDDEDELQVIESQKTDAHHIYLEHIKLSNDENSKLIGGGAGLADQKSFVGSAEAQERILNDIVEAMKRKETFHHNSILFPLLVKHGYPFKGKEFRYLTYSQNNPDEEEDETNKSASPSERPGSRQGAGGGRAKKMNRGAQAKLSLNDLLG